MKNDAASCRRRKEIAIQMLAKGATTKQIQRETKKQTGTAIGCSTLNKLRHTKTTPAYEELVTVIKIYKVRK